MRLITLLVLCLFLIILSSAVCATEISCPEILIAPQTAEECTIAECENAPVQCVGFGGGFCGLYAAEFNETNKDCFCVCRSSCILEGAACKDVKYGGGYDGRCPEGWEPYKDETGEEAPVDGWGCELYVNNSITIHERCCVEIPTTTTPPGVIPEFSGVTGIITVIAIAVLALFLFLTKRNR